MIEPAASTTFRHGVASGDPTPRRVVIWTRISGAPEQAPVAVRWRVVEADGERAVANGQSLAQAEAN